MVRQAFKVMAVMVCGAFSVPATVMAQDLQALARVDVENSSITMNAAGALR
ncbi:MAG: hypothetical protein KC451_15715 [Amylibacter sp.]|nr:hypothetical protein [Amylibacter sp.]